MTTLFAHHLEPAFLPIYAGQFALGVWVGWRMAVAVLRKFAA
jgi:hypothetical protein